METEDFFTMIFLADIIKVNLKMENIMEKEFYIIKMIKLYMKEIMSMGKWMEMEKLVYQNGSYYVGQFKDGKRHGDGIEYNKNGKLIRNVTNINGECIQSYHDAYVEDISGDDGEKDYGEEEEEGEGEAEAAI